MTKMNLLDALQESLEKTKIYIDSGLAKKADSSHKHNYAGSSSAGGAATSANKVNTNLIIKLNGGSTEGTNLFTFNGSTAKTINITPSSIGAAASSHGTHLTIVTGASNAAAGNLTHNYAGSSSAGGAATSANKVNTNLSIKLNGGTTEGTNLFTFNGSAAKTINITPSSIGAAASSHGTHLSLGTTSSTAYRGDYGNTAYNHSQSAHAPSNAQKNSDITKAEIEAKLTGVITTHKHTLLESNDTRSKNELPSTYINRGIVPEFKSSATIGLPEVGKGFTGLITYQQWSDTSAWSGGKATQFGTIDDGRMYYRKGDGSGWGTWYQFYTTQNKPTPADIGAASASHGTHVTYASAAPKANGTAAVGTSAKVAREDHVHPLQTTVSGNAGTATKFASSQSVALTGDVTGSGSSQAGWSIATTLNNSGVTAGSYGPSANASPAHSGTFSVPYITVDAKGRVTAASTKTITLPSDNNTWRGIQNNLTSTATDQSLSANQGNVLKRLIDNHTADTTTHITANERTAWNAKSNLTLGTTSTTAFRGDRGNTAYNHSQAAHAPSNAQKNSDITKSEIEAKLTGNITSHTHTSLAQLTVTGNVSANSFTENGIALSNKYAKMVTLSQAEYDALTSYDNNTLYVII